MAKQNTKTQISERQQYIQKLQQKVETRKKVSKIFIQVFRSDNGLRNAFIFSVYLTWDFGQVILVIKVLKFSKLSRLNVNF